MGKLTTAKWPRTGHSRGANMIAPIAGLVAIGALAALAVWAYPEFRRYMHIRQM